MESPNSSLTVKQDAHRPLADFPDTIWENPLASFSISDPANETNDKGQLNVLKEKVKEMLIASEANPMENIRFIDVLCRLGVSYHFETEIEERLEQIFGSHDFHVSIRGDDCDVHTVALVFQVFRQFGFKLSSDVFDKFKNEGGQFKEHLGVDARGMLSLYEAAQWSTRGEDILDEALDFSRSHLDGLASRSCPHLALRIRNALKRPYHKGMPRIEARQYISYYEEEESHDEILLKFAKLDFNLLQLLHREELAKLSRWNEDIEMASKLPYARDRIVECYLWAFGTYFEPQYSRARIMLAKIVAIETILDDTYDAYGTMEELALLADAIDRWHPSAIDGLPDNMKHVYKIILDFFDEFKEELVKDGRTECVTYAEDGFKLSAKGYHQEAEWLHEDYTATFEEYAENGVVNCAYNAIIAASFLGMDEAKVSAFEWLRTIPRILKASQIISRFIDDITSSEFEKKRKHVATAIECYMKQYSVSSEKAVEAIQMIITNAWKDMNEEFMRPHAVSSTLLMRILNLTRVLDVFYKYEDAFTNPKFLKDYVVSLFVETIPI